MGADEFGKEIEWLQREVKAARQRLVDVRAVIAETSGAIGILRRDLTAGPPVPPERTPAGESAQGEERPPV